MQIKNNVPESDALTIAKSASALGIHEFSLLSRVQAGDIIAARLWSGEIAIPISELERLSKLSIYSLAIPPDKPEGILPDARMGIKRDAYSGLKRDGEHQEYSVPGGDFRHFTDSEMKGYRAAFSVIAPEFESLGVLRKQLEKPATVVASTEKEICTSKIGVWQVRSTLLNLGPSNILLCQKQDDFAVIERFRDNVPYAKANGIAVATAQRVIWTQFHEHRPERLVAAISERCRLAVSDEETISQTPAEGHTHSNKQGHNRGQSMGI